MKNIILLLLFGGFLLVSVSCNNTKNQAQTVDYTEIDSIAKIDATKFVTYISNNKLTEMQLEDEILKFKSRQYSIRQEYGSDFSDRYAIKFKETVKCSIDSLGNLFGK